MKTIVLACSAGMSTSLLEKSMNEHIEDNKLDYKVIAVPSGEAKILIENKKQDFDIILLGPQVSYMLSQFKSITDKPVDVIPPNIYALAKGPAVIEFAEKVLNK
ncbi:PTS sugar transporter subunit IIB [Spiroplasma endosymbiont of Anurida maritima]|uniref:PTS sugar transporter subunit IIB n=1 Tax=Spiroplasma endosymbiont of Anurida maritima TaxID=2967972 RepID=UPI0036D2B792